MMPAMPAAPAAPVQYSQYSLPLQNSRAMPLPRGWSVAVQDVTVLAVQDVTALAKASAERVHRQPYFWHKLARIPGQHCHVPRQHFSAGHLMSSPTAQRACRKPTGLPSKANQTKQTYPTFQSLLFWMGLQLCCGSLWFRPGMQVAPAQILSGTPTGDGSLLVGALESATSPCSEHC